MFKDWLATKKVQEGIYDVAYSFGDVIGPGPYTEETGPELLIKLLESAYDAGVADENEFWQSHGHHTA